MAVKRRVNAPRELLYGLYVVKRLPLHKISKQIPCAKSTLLRLLKQYGFASRLTPFETMKVGDRFGSLTLISPLMAGSPPKWHWRCRCDCGHEFNTRPTGLFRGTVTECKRCVVKNGFAKKRATPLSVPFWHLNRAKRGADMRDLPFEITHEQVSALFDQCHGRCVRTGRPIRIGRHIHDGETTASLDRIDSKFGYVEGNVQWVHKTYNKCKHVLNQEEFDSLVIDRAKMMGFRLTPADTAA